MRRHHAAGLASSAAAWRSVYELQVFIAFSRAEHLDFHEVIVTEFSCSLFLYFLRNLLIPGILSIFNLSRISLIAMKIDEICNDRSSFHIQVAFGELHKKVDLMDLVKRFPRRI